jgi:hypothetical protein
LGYQSIRHTVRYTNVAPTRVKSLFQDGTASICSSNSRGWRRPAIDSLLTIGRFNIRANERNGAAMDQMLMLRIRERAYEIWVASGGEAEENWLRAEAELLKNCASRPPIKRKRRATAT